MQIVDFRPDMADAVARCYSDVVAGAPYCRPVGGEWFATPGKRYRQPLAEEALLVAREGEEIRGFVELGVAAPKTEDWHVAGEPGVIRFLGYRRGERAVGAELFRAAEDWLRARKAAKVLAGHCDFHYPFYHLPFAHISERISHLPPLFGMAGYEVEESEIFFLWEEADPPAVCRPDLEVEIEGGWQERVAGIGPGVALRVHRAGERVGVCDIASLASEEWRPELADACFCIGLHLDERVQGRGLGKYLLARGLLTARERGLRHALISADWNNWRAYLFYTNFGFRFLDRTFALSKTLTASGDE